MPHAYFVVDSSERGIAKASAFAERELKVASGSSDLVILRYLHFSVEEARHLTDIAMAAPIEGHKVIVIATTRFFHEAQNALLKLFEEPPKDVTLILVLPSGGMLLPTLRSRLASLPDVSGEAGLLSPLGEAFLASDATEREKLITKLIDQSKSDKDEEKQEARSAAVRLAEDLLRDASAKKQAVKSPEEARRYQALITDLLHFLPLLHTRSAPLKLIFEHLLLVIPTGTRKGKV
ncbi:MAG TPA: hypothetical protein VGB97_01560 [Candidatus Paceibacterota bacterium]|jgi:hypothetical protein